MKTCLLFPNGKEKALTLSYDDGVDTDVRFIELLEKFKIKCCAGRLFSCKFRKVAVKYTIF